MIVDVQYVSGGQVRAFISGGGGGGGKGGIIGQGEWDKKGDLVLSPFLSHSPWPMIPPSPPPPPLMNALTWPPLTY